VLAFDWANLAAAGAFVAGLAVGVLVTIRLAKVLAGYLIDLRKQNDDDDRR
jgi:hypothetical protein